MEIQQRQKIKDIKRLTDLVEGGQYDMLTVPNSLILVGLSKGLDVIYYKDDRDSTYMFYREGLSLELFRKYKN